MVYRYNGILLNHKEEWNFPICDNLEGPKMYYAKGNITQSEVRQRKTNAIWLHLCVKSKNKTNQNSDRTVLVASREEGGGWCNEWREWGDTDVLWWNE